MGTPWTPEQRIAAYKREGLTKIVYMPGWKTHNRDDETGKTFGPVHGVVIHHTAGVGSGLAQYCYRGTSSLPGPICHDFLAKDGTLYVIGHGRTNHAGTVTPAVAAELQSVHPIPSRSLLEGTETVDGNDFLYGLEIENEGDGSDPYPPVQYDVAVRWAAAHARHHGWDANSVWGHKEITRRKVDPSFPMPAFRDAVQRRLTPAPPTNGASVMDYTSLARTAATVMVNPGTSAKIYFDTEYVDEPGDHGANGKTVLSGRTTGRYYTGTLSLAFAAALPAGVSVRMVRERSGFPDSGEPATDLTAGLDHSVSVTGHVAADYGLVAEVTNSSGSSVTIWWAGIRLLSRTA